MPSFDVPGALLDVELSDEGGVPVVQLHGLTSSRARDRVLALDLGRGLSGTRLLRYDARGHGRSTGRTEPADYRWPRLGEDLLLLLDAFFPGERVHGVGPSMGAGTLLHAAVLDPDRFSGLTLLIPPTAWETRAAQAEAYRKAGDLVAAGGFEAYVRAGRTVQPPATVDLPPTLPEVSVELLPSVLRGAAASDFPEPAEVARIAVPTTILAWTDDPGHPRSTAEALHRHLPTAELAVAKVPDDLDTWPGMLADAVARGEAGHQ